MSFNAVPSGPPSQNGYSQRKDCFPDRPALSLLTERMQEAILNALRSVKYPGYSRDIVSFGLVKDVAVNHGAVSVLLQLTSASPEQAQQLKREAEDTLRALPGVKAVHVDVRVATTTAPARSPWANQNKVPGIARIIA